MTNDPHYVVRKPAMIAGAMSHRDEIGLAGLGITDDLFLRVVAAFLPKCRVARVFRLGWLDRLEVAKREWDAPKTVLNDRKAAEYQQSQARSAAR
jgi:hypothetical protein